MHPHAKLSLSLILALVLWLPTLDAVIGGGTDLFSGALRFAVALTGARVAIGVISNMWATYAPVDQAGHHHLLRSHDTSAIDGETPATAID